MKHSLFLLMLLLSSASFSCALRAMEFTESAYNWPMFMHASEARFQAQYERAKMMSMQDDACQQEKETEQLLRCLKNDVFVRQAIEQSGLSINEYASHWHTLHINNQRLNQTFLEYERLKARWR